MHYQPRSVLPGERSLSLAGVVWPLSDAKHPLHFPVKRVDQKKGIVGDPKRCMLARALKRVMPEATAIFVFRTRAYIPTRDGELIRYDLTDHTKRVIRRFDETETLDFGGKGEILVGFRAPASRTRLGASHKPTGTGRPRSTVPAGARRPIGTIRGGFSSFRSTPATPTMEEEAIA